VAFRSVVTLSRRESEVAELVRDGLTNREIGNRLFISERTVEGHVAQICNKLGFRSRIQIATQMRDDDNRTAPVRTAHSRPFRVVTQLVQPPWWVLAAMGLGAPLAVGAALYPWIVPQTSTTTISLKILLTCLALLFLVIPTVALAGLWFGRPWGEPLAIRGLVGVGSLVLLLAAATLASSLASGRGFRPADSLEFAYAIAVVPLLLAHLGGLVTTYRQARLSKLLITGVSLFWIVRYGYGLSLSALVLWLLWHDQPSRASGRK
jgi:DNA-binding CsgD family transcriptional regulator